MTMPIRPAAVAQHVARRQAAEQATAETVLAAIEALHHPTGRRKTRCAECDQIFPCRTVRIIDNQGER